MAYPRSLLVGPKRVIPMSTRCRNDLIGSSSRMQSTLSRWIETTSAIEELWNDETAKNFYVQSLGEVGPVMTRMIASLQEAVDLVRTIEKKVTDPDT